MEIQYIIVNVAGCIAFFITTLYMYVSVTDNQLDAIDKIANIKVTNTITRDIWLNREFDEKPRSMQTLYSRILWIKELEKNSDIINELLKTGQIVLEGNAYRSKAGNILADQLLEYLSATYSQTNVMKSPKNYQVKINEVLNLNKKNN